MVYRVVLFLLTVFPLSLSAQTNISISSSIADNVLKGNYNPANYTATVVINRHEEIACLLDDQLSADSLLNYLEVLDNFHTRHTFSDTTSPDSGIGAARRWIKSKLDDFSARNENRLLTAYLSFDQPPGSCDPANGLKNVLAFLPGTDPNSAPVIVEAHMDSRCEGRCDDSCSAPGVDDNASGTALVMELARVMSRFTFEHTIVFMLTTGEEQGLLGAAAMAEYCFQNNIELKAVQNNDVIGGIVCGETASPPGCDPPYSIDSTSVRLYTSPSFLQANQGFARTVKIYYYEKIRSQVKVPMDINIINQEDRLGRGGDHIPFRQRGYTNVRFCSTHEHGDASVTDTSYMDHQHTSNDILGVDTDNDGQLDTFYVDVNYLRRNTLINGVSLTMLALGPEVPQWNLKNDANGLTVEITNGLHPEYRVGVRTNNVDFDGLYRFSGNSFNIPGLQNNTLYFISVAAIDSNKIMSPFSAEELAQSQVTNAAGIQDTLPYSINCALFSINEPLAKAKPKSVEFLPVKPNPTSGEVQFTIIVNEKLNYRSAFIIITNNQGKEVKRLPLALERGTNTIDYLHSGEAGIYFSSLEINGQLLTSQKMVMQ